jgi:ABC-type amino acid transport substrate-binding protein
MEGIQFVTDDKGKKVAVQIDLARHGEMWEDIYDQLLADERAKDKRLPYETVRRRLVRGGKLRA